MAAPATEDDGPPLTELEGLQLKANQITDESLDSTRRMIQLCEDSKEAGIKTLVALDDQGEPSCRDKNLRHARSSRRHAKIRDTDASWKGSSSTKDKKAVVKKEPGKSGSMTSGPYIDRITNDAREDEMEENMQEVGTILGNLKNMAKEMGDEIEGQNKQVDRINAKTQHVDMRIGAANKRTEKLLK